MPQLVKALGAGANEYVMKPFTKEVIADKLALLGVVR
jgi:two-component system chemotaxis response regulator CheY